MNAIEKLVRKFSEFPGIGPKQARRFVYFLIRQSDAYVGEFKREIDELRSDITVCAECKRYFAKNGAAKICNICADGSRDRTALLVVSRDIDLENIEKSGSFAGTYFVLGGAVPVLDKEPEKRIRLKDLLALVEKRAANGLREIILGLDANAEGEYTGEIVSRSLVPLAEKHGIKISELGRGLSSGTELEYSDPETIKNALKNRQ
ncbi:MAG: toprim domain-containing protein [Patescibacteria group bacterium]|nr:toprim domain-containing protein [Patescibacteria group bacterium]MDE1945943.1 toprim domain-containing protein [Patescibacteria group bacterium]